MSWGSEHKEDAYDSFGNENPDYEGSEFDDGEFDDEDWQELHDFQEQQNEFQDDQLEATDSLASENTLRDVEEAIEESGREFAGPGRYDDDGDEFDDDDDPDDPDGPGFDFDWREENEFDEERHPNSFIYNGDPGEEYGDAEFDAADSGYEAHYNEVDDDSVAEDVERTADATEDLADAAADGDGDWWEDDDPDTGPATEPPWMP